MRTKILSTVIILSMVGLGCSKSSTTDAAATANIVNQVYTNLQSATPDFSTSSMLNIGSEISPLDTSIGSNLSTANVFPDVDNPGSITKTGIEYLGTLFGNTAQNSVFWRAKMPFLISCTLDALATKGNNLYSTSQTSVVMASSVIGVCGSASDFTGGDNSSLIGTSVTFTIADLADTTYYDQVIDMPGSSNSQFGGNDQYMYVRNNSTTLNFMHVELNSGNTNVTINTLHYDKSAGEGHYQYASFSSGGGSFVYRVYMNSADNVSRVFTYWKMTSSPAHTIITNVASTYSNQTSANLSISFTGLGGGGSTALENGNACVDLTTAPPTLSSDNTLTCGSTTITAAGAISGHAIGTALAALSGSTIRTWASTPTSGATKFPSFTASTINSAALGL